MKGLFAHLKNDIPAAIVVFFVALPLCLGIALASGVEDNLFSGLIAGIVGGIVVGAISGSNIGVSGPAAGLAAIVATAIVTLDGFENFLVAVVIAGALQIAMGFMRAGVIGYFFPSSVIKGMLTGIGIFIFLKQVPHFFGYDEDPMGDWAFLQINGKTTFSDIPNAILNPTVGSLVIGIIALGILLLWEFVLSSKGKIFKLVQGPLVAVVVGIIFYLVVGSEGALGIGQKHLVNVPVPDSFDSFRGQFTLPNFAAIARLDVWIVGFTIALVASLETLLCVEATDKLDPHKGVTPTNRELLAQGTGNMISGFIGGLPITQVIVRSSANIQSGGRTKMSAIIHGFFLLISVVTIPEVLNLIPKSVLAAILLLVGYKLAKPSLFKKMWQLGWMQFIPFMVTILGIIFIDLLWGVGLGLAVGIVFILYASYKNSHFLHRSESKVDNRVTMELAEEVTFFNKATILKELDALPQNTQLELDVRKTKYLDYDVIEILDDFAYKARERNIDIKVISQRGVVKNPDSYVEFFNLPVAAQEDGGDVLERYDEDRLR